MTVAVSLFHLVTDGRIIMAGVDSYTFPVLATESVKEAVNKFAQGVRELTTEERTLLIKYLESAEDEADHFPFKVETSLSKLLGNDNE